MKNNNGREIDVIFVRFFVVQLSLGIELMQEESLAN